MTIPIEQFSPSSLRNLRSYLDALIKGRLWVKMLISMLLGIAVGMLLGPSVGLVGKDTSSVIGHWLALPGQLFLSLVQMIILPLVFSSIITGIASSKDTTQLRSLGIRVIIYFLLTTTVAITIGIGITTVLQPGQHIDTELIEGISRQNVTPEVEDPAELLNLVEIPEKIIGILPQNPMQAMLKFQMLQVVLFAIIIGIALLSMSRKHSEPLLNLLYSLQQVCMTIVGWAMALAPVVVFCFLANLTSQVGFALLIGMAAYVGTVLVGLILLLCFYLLIVYFVSGRSPLDFLSKVHEVQLLGFATSSSAAVMPLSMETAESKLNVRSSISQLMIPLGATINMDGTALYQAAATVFMMQVFGVELSLPSLVLITVMAVSASIGAPATPGVGIVILSMVLDSAGIPAGGIALIIGVDRILDMSRTAINLTGDLTACTVMDRWVGGPRNEIDRTEYVMEDVSEA